MVQTISKHVEGLGVYQQDDDGSHLYTTGVFFFSKGRYIAWFTPTR